MAFRTLNEVIKNQLAKFKTQELNFPMSIRTTLYFDQPIHLENKIDDTADSFTWGFSTWGVDVITGYSKPEDI